MVSVCEPHPGTADRLFQTFIFTFITDTRYVNIYFELPKNRQTKQFLYKENKKKLASNV